MSYNIQINGKIEIEGRLDENKDISVAIKRLGLRSISRKPQSVDGEDEEVTYKYQNLEDITVIQEEKIIVGKPKKGSIAQAIRIAVEKVYNEQFSGGDEYRDSEDYYQSEMHKVLDTYKEKLQ